MKDALILVDIQNDFLSGGALAVPDGDAIIPVVNQLQKKFELVVATQDHHPANHGSFAANYNNKMPGEVIDLEGLPQILWPVHCVQQSAGTQFHPALDMSRVKKIFPKGENPLVDSYSGFFDNGKKQATGLESFLKDAGVNKVYVVGLAADYCVKFTALDAQSLGFETFVIKDATRAVNLQPGDFDKALEEMQNEGIKVIDSKDIL